MAHKGDAKMLDRIQTFIKIVQTFIKNEWKYIRRGGHESGGGIVDYSSHDSHGDCGGHADGGCDGGGH